ncbi:MAG TPA: Gfo/Idh/MocA family oxidoreductase [Candidatus Saccharimonadales bacterium]|nr:Gfo/Idh/MocA family oxidoreductase [Candidatus Saccharimonadales bacterium]
MSQPIRVILLGAGFARRVQGPAFARHPDYRLVGLASARLESARAAASELGVQHASDDWRRLLEEVECDLVSVVTPPSLHHPMARRALELGRDLLLEKPAAMDAAQVEDLLALAGSRGRVHALNHEYRWVPARAFARELARRGEIGRVIRFVARSHYEFFSRQRGMRWGWLCDAAAGGGMWGAIGSHLVDYAQWVMGPARAVTARMETQVAARPDAAGLERAVTADDGFIVQADFEGGATGLFEGSAAVAHRDDVFELHGEAGTLVIENDVLYRLAPGKPREAVAVEPAFEIARHGADARLDPCYALLTALAARVRDRGEFRPSLADGLATQRVLDAARASHAQGRRAEVPR